QTLCDENVAQIARDKTERNDLAGDGDPLDICVLTEKNIAHGNLLAYAIPIGGLRMIDGNQADDKIIAVLKDDAVYGHIRNIDECPEAIITRLRHYFLTYKDLPGTHRDCEITHVYGVEEAHQIIKAALTDYRKRFENLDNILSQYGMMKP
nr:inorganic diphosphatase [Bacteroidales bacterium]